MKAKIFEIKRFAVHDGDGIRTTVFFKGCNLYCPWCHNPENLRPEPAVLHYKQTGRTECMGKKVSPEEILPELLEDLDFYAQSGGGVTFSGGEVMLQAQAAAELAKLLKQQDIPVLIDTAGSVPYRRFETLNPFVAGYLFDFKTADAEKYRTIGGDLKLVTDNIRRLMSETKDLRIRIPLIPGFNANEASILAIARYLTEMGIREADLLPFHRLGSGKYEAMGLPYAYAQIQPMSRQTLADIQSLFLGEGLQVTCEE